MKKGKFIALDFYKNVKIGYGTVDHKNLKTIYIKLNSWIEPEECGEINELLSKTKRKIKLRIHELNSDLFKRECIVDLDVKTKGIKLGKRSFLNSTPKISSTISSTRDDTCGFAIWQA